MTTILWIIAVVLVVAGVFALICKEMLCGAVLIIGGLLGGPGGVSLFSRPVVLSGRPFAPAERSPQSGYRSSAGAHPGRRHE